MYRYFCLAFLAAIPLFFSTSCKKEVKTSTMLVTVKYNDSPVKGIHVFTVPGNGDPVTDAYGIVRITGVQPGIYDVYAENGYLSGKTTISLNSDEIREVTVNIDYTGAISFLPELAITLPDISYHPAPGDTVVFQARVKNQKAGAGVTWSSNIQGTLATTAIDGSGISNFPTNKLLAGIHTITAKVEGKEGYSAIRSREIAVDGPPGVWLYPLVPVQGGYRISWSKYRRSGFESYTLCYRYKQDPEDDYFSTSYLTPVTDMNDTVTDFTLTVTWPVMQFYIQVSGQDGKTNISNRREVLHSMGQFFNEPAIQVMPHPVNETAYLVFADKIVLYDYIQQRIVAENQVNTTSKFIDINDNGSGLEVYLPDHASVHVLDGNSLVLKRTIQFPHDVISVTSSGQGFLICSQMSDSANVMPLQVYSLSQQQFIQSGGTPYSHYYMKKIPGKNALAACTRSGYASMLDYFEFSNTGAITLSNHIPNASGGFTVDVMEMSPDGNYFVLDDDGWVRKTDPNLTSLVSLDGPSGKNDYTFNDSGSSFYCTAEYSSQIYEYHYPSGSYVNTFPILGRPGHLFYRNGKCMVMEYYSYLDRYFMEVVDVSRK